jgi:hypothetical protein
MLDVKILSYKTPQRYAVRQTLISARNELRKTIPDFDISISEVNKLEEIEEITSVVVYPSLVINGKHYCTGWFPRKDEVIKWFTEALTETHKKPGIISQEI